jgi:hypothetical protein
LEIDLIFEKHLEIYPVEIKITMTPKIGMAKPIEQFQKSFSKLNVQTGTIISLINKQIHLTRNVISQPLELFLSNMKHFD